MKLNRSVLVVIAACALGLMVAAPAVAAGPPSNDNYLSSTIIPASLSTATGPASYSNTEDTTAAGTQSDLFNPQQNGLPFAGGGPEPLSCNGVTYGKTVWYDLHPKIPMGLELQASGYPSVIAVYQWSTATSRITRQIGCQAQTSPAPNSFVLPQELKKGNAYTVQVGGVQTPGAVAAGTLSFTAMFFPDHDGDGIYDPLDACVFLAGVPRFGGCPPTVNALLSYAYSSSGPAGLAITRFTVTSLPAGARVRAQCSCGVSQTATVGRRANSVGVPGFVGRRLPVGASIQIWATKRAAGTAQYKHGAIGAYRKYTVTSGGLTAPLKRCLMPGSMTPRKQCPPGGRRRAQ